MFQCPKCKDTESANLRLTADVLTYIDVDGDEEVMDSEPVNGMEWDEKTTAECLDCGWTGTVEDISIEETEEEEVG